MLDPDGEYPLTQLANGQPRIAHIPDQAYCLPLTECVYQTLKESLREYASDDVAFAGVFEEFEILLSLVSMNVDAGNDPETATPPRGRFAYARRYSDEETTYEHLKAETAEQGSNWGAPAPYPILVGYRKIEK